MKRVGKLLLEGDMLRPDELERALIVQKREGGRLLKVLLGRDYFTSGELYQFLASLGFPTLDPLNYHIERHVLSLI